jgi:hypothetical protein
MTQKSSPDKLEETLQQTIDPSEIADPSVRRTVEILLNWRRAVTSRNKRTTVRESEASRRK